MCTVHPPEYVWLTLPFLVFHPVNLIPVTVIRSVLRAVSVTLDSLGFQMAVCIHISVAAQTLEASTTASTQLSGTAVISTGNANTDPDDDQMMPNEELAQID